jgi:hypothetical protein
MGLKEQKRAAEKQFLGSSAKVSHIDYVIIKRVKIRDYESNYHKDI